MCRVLNPERPVLRAARLAPGTKFPVDYSAAETLRSIFAVMKETGIRVVVAEMMDDVRERSRYRLWELFG